ncbi:hypothetical protein EJB05_08475 [Eragrostis curvula]|uniref:Uncharacterized protein n=1 Tax=Eragrostis curvula TaxID=38414 RepID=A0A5J9W1P2_9POAL|nr:hypothetical protein EJB05_08475 [Eragrostis curvula]
MLSSPSLRPSPPPLLAPCPPPTPVSNDAVAWELQKWSGWTELPKGMDGRNSRVLRPGGAQDPSRRLRRRSTSMPLVATRCRAARGATPSSGSLAMPCQRVHAQRENSTKDNFGKSRQTKDTMLNGLLKLRSSSPATSLFSFVLYMSNLG